MLMYVNTLSPAGGDVRGGLGGMALLKEVHRWEWALRAFKASPYSQLFLSARSLSLRYEFSVFISCHHVCSHAMISAR